MRRSFLVPIAAAALTATLACGGIAGYGREFGSVEVYDGVEFELVFTAEASKAYELWLEYDVEYEGDDWKVAGPIQMTVDDASAGTWRLDFHGEGEPVVGQSGRTVFGTSSFHNGSWGGATGTIYLLELPPQPAGTEVLITGTFTGSAGTDVRSLRLAVTN